MATAIKVTFSVGDRNRVYQALDGLLPKLKRRALSKGLRAGMKVIQTSAKQRMPTDTGTAARSLIVRAWTKRKRGQIAYEVRYNTAKILASSPNGFFYPAVVEYGSVKRHRKPVAPMKQTYERDGPAAVAEAVRVIEAEAQKIIAGLRP